MQPPVNVCLFNLYRVPTQNLSRIKRVDGVLILRPRTVDFGKIGIFVGIKVCKVFSVQSIPITEINIEVKFASRTP